jgi:hypothetical protein
VGWGGGWEWRKEESSGMMGMWMRCEWRGGGRRGGKTVVCVNGDNCVSAMLSDKFSLTHLSIV